MEEVVPTTIGTSEGATTVPVVDLSKVRASELLKSKVPRLPYSKRQVDPQKDYASKKAKSVSAYISNAVEEISQYFGSHHESVLAGKNKGASGAEYHSFEKKKVVNDSSKD